MRRPLGCMTFTALLAGIVTVLVIVAAIALAGGSIFSPGALSAFAQPDVTTASSLGGVHSHAELEGKCDACHVAIWSGQKMGDKCLGCHEDVGRQKATGQGLHAKLDATAATCLRCHTEHNGPDAPATLADPAVFPHDQTGFALTAHLRPAVADSLNCRACHLSSPKNYAGPTCIGCHQQRNPAKMAEHVDTFGPTCLNCHDGKDTYGHAFAHTGYPLTGKHDAAPCASCHKGGTTLVALKATSTLCATCHQKDDPHGGRLGSSCGDCHTPAGWAGAKLDHTTQTRFPLTGKHTAAACESCHTNRQWTGIGTTCAACHQKDDAHAGKFGTDCASCHNPSDWKDVTFDHAKTGFALVASHAKVDCASCHQNNQFAGTPTNCAGCHASNDKHNGALGSDCETCHTATAWSDGAYNHNRATFKLTGAHAGATCEQCHKTGPPKATSTACTSCHTRPAAHDGHFGNACASCHSTSAWRPAAFNHSTTPYTLTGAHLSVTCQKCHGTPTTTYAGAPSICASCHNRPASHTAAFGSSCGTCHTTRAWLPASFDHSKSAFPLTGAHVSVTCQRCHTTPGTFAGTPTACASCHGRPSSHTAAFGSNCATCHSTRAWTPATFNHATTGWSLTGAHTSLTCSKCHTGPTFTGLSTSCNSCHSKPSNHPSGYTSCNQCHSTSAWTPVRYTGAHTFPIGHGGANGVCWTCHPSTLTSYTCAKCHNPNNIDGHAGRSSSQCASCHPTGQGGG